MIDIFGVNYNFRYKEKERYGTALGGFFIVLLIVLVFVMGIYYFIPFVNRKNYTIVYYTMNLAKTEEVNIFDSESNIAVGLNCDSSSKDYDIYDLIDLKSRFVQYEKFKDGTYGKVPKTIIVDKCEYSDFYNKFDDQFDYLGIKDFTCIKNKEFTIQGIYSDQVFSYYEFSAVAKNTSLDLIDKIDKFLYQNDCKLQFVYTDIIIDLDNYENPITQYLDEVFIQLNPTLFIKRNIFFRNQYFTNDNFLMFVFGDDEVPETKPLYSRYEEYALYKGFQREAEIEDFEYYSKLYIRADLKKTIIKRKYQKFMEFYADASSLLIAIYEILVVIFNYVDTFYAHHSLAQSMFFFKDLESEDSFNVFKKLKEINEIISITELQKGKNSELGSSLIQSKGSKGIKNAPPKKLESSQVKKEENNKNVKIYNSRKQPIENKNTKNSSNMKSKIYEESKINKANRQLNEKYDEKPSDYYNEEYDDNYEKYKMDRMRYKRNSSANMNFRKKDYDENQFNESIGTNMDEENSSETERPTRKRQKKLKVYNSFNIFEIIITQFFKCCMSKSMKIKNEANEKANSVLFSKMDINCYVRNMILFDIVNQTILNDKQRVIVNFLCRPVICYDKKSKAPLPEFYRKYREKDFNNFSEKIEELASQEKKENGEKKIISIANEQLKAFL